jgi:hypothetical protein
MSLAGGAFLALWNDVAAEHDDEYNRWHSTEHVAERVSVPGFIAGRRYIALEPAQQVQSHVERYFTLYEIDTLDVLDSAPYRHLLDHPSAWSASMRPHFRNLVRAGCASTWSTRRGIGAYVAVVRLHAALDAGTDNEALDLVDDALRRSLRERPGITGLRAGVAGPRVTGLPWTATATVTAMPVTSVMMLESYAAAPLHDALAAITSSARAKRASASTQRVTGIYSLAYMCWQSNPPA